MKCKGANSVRCGAKIAVYVQLTHNQTRIKAGDVRGGCRVVRYIKPVCGDPRKPEHLEFLRMWQGLAGHHLDEIVAVPKEEEEEVLPVEEVYAELSTQTDSELQFTF